VLEAVRQNGRALQNASPELRGDRELVLEAVRQNGLALQNASENLQGDRELVLEAVTQDGLALQYASPELKKNIEVVSEAVRQNFLGLRFAKEEKMKEVIINKLSKEIPPANADGEDPNKKDNIDITKDFFQKVKKITTKGGLCFDTKSFNDCIESFNDCFGGYSIRHLGETKEYIPYVANLFQSECELSERDAFILANCIGIATKCFLDETEEGRENLEFLKPLVKEIEMSMFKTSTKPHASIQPNRLTQCGYTGWSCFGVC